MTELTVSDLYGLMTREYKGRDPGPFVAEQFPPGTRWVMDLASYECILAACRAGGAVYPPGKREPAPEDRLFGLPVEVREDGGKPHLEET